MILNVPEWSIHGKLATGSRPKDPVKSECFGFLRCLDCKSKAWWFLLAFFAQVRNASAIAPRAQRGACRFWMDKLTKFVKEQSLQRLVRDVGLWVLVSYPSLSRKQVWPLEIQSFMRHTKLTMPIYQWWGWNLSTRWLHSEGMRWLQVLISKRHKTKLESQGDNPKTIHWSSQIMGYMCFFSSFPWQLPIPWLGHVVS